MDINEWNKTLAQAEKVLGDEAVVPLDKIAAMSKAIQDANKFHDAYPAARKERFRKIVGLIGEIEDANRDLLDAISTLRNTLGQAEDVLTTSEYGLDPRDPVEKKKIEQAHTLFKNYFQAAEQSMTRYKAKIQRRNSDLESFKDKVDV